MNRRDCQKMEGMFKQWIDERKKQGPDSQRQQVQKEAGPASQQIQIDSQQIERVLKQQSLVERQEHRKRSKEKAMMCKDLLNSPCPTNALQPKQGEDVRKAVLLGADQRHRVESNNSTCSVA